VFVRTHPPGVAARLGARLAEARSRVEGHDTSAISRAE
jgi:hypothetical protein